MRKLASLLALTAVAAAALASTALGSGRSVTLRDNSFSTHSLTVKRGSTVSWHWSHTRHNHDVTGSGFASAVGKSGSFSHRFSRRGTFTVICTIHPKAMRMTVHVR